MKSLSHTFVIIYILQNMEDMFDYSLSNLLVFITIINDYIPQQRSSGVNGFYSEYICTYNC